MTDLSKRTNGATKTYTYKCESCGSEAKVRDIHRLGERVCGFTSGFTLGTNGKWYCMFCAASRMV